MKPEEEFAARSQLKWQRDGDEWVLLYRRRRMGRVVLDSANPGMYRSLKSGDFARDISNLSWAKGAVLAQAIREVAYELANDPSKCPVNGGLKKQFRHPCVFLRRLSKRGPNETPRHPYGPRRDRSIIGHMAKPWPVRRRRPEPLGGAGRSDSRAVLDGLPDRLYWSRGRQTKAAPRVLRPICYGMRSPTPGIQYAQCVHSRTGRDYPHSRDGQAQRPYYRHLAKM